MFKDLFEWHGDRWNVAISFDAQEFWVGVSIANPWRCFKINIIPTLSVKIYRNYDELYN